MRRKLEGIVELDAIVTASGCTGTARVTKSLGSVDIQALAAVLQWRFDPARLEDGRPVPVVVSVELTFTLRR